MNEIVFRKTTGEVGLSTGTTYVEYFQQYVVTGNTQAYYKYDNNLLDSGPNGYNGTSGTTISYQSGILQSNSVKISGITYNITYSNPVIPVGQKMISFWIYNYGGSADYSSIFSTNNIFGVSKGTSIYITGNVNLEFQIRGGGADGASDGIFTIILNNAIPLNTWTHIICQWDGTSGTNSVKIYKNGVVGSQATNTKTEGTPSTYNLRIGNGWGSNSNCYFLLDELIIENRAWTSTEVLDYYQKILANI